MLREEKILIFWAWQVQRDSLLQPHSHPPPPLPPPHSGSQETGLNPSLCFSIQRKKPAFLGKHGSHLQQGPSHRDNFICSSSAVGHPDDVIRFQLSVILRYYK